MNEEESVKRIETMKYKTGDRVKIKSLDWYNANRDKDGYVDVGVIFDKEMSRWCGKTMTILKVNQLYYAMEEDYISQFYWTDEMIEGLVEEKTSIKLTGKAIKNNEMVVSVGEYILPDDYIIKDENGNVINATKIVLEKKKKEYPKSYEECCKVLDFCGEYFFTTYEEGTHLPENDNIASIHQILKSVSILTKLLICRNAYWKLYGEEMGLGEPWEPDWNDERQDKYGFYNECKYTIINSATFVFPTAEMRDAYYENFKEEIEKCKELL